MLTRKRATPGAKTTATAKAARKGTGEEIPATAKTAPKDPVENTARKELGEKTLVTPKQQSSEKTSAAARKETGAKTPVNEKTTPKQQSSEKTSAAARKDSGETTPANAKTVSKTTPASVTSAPLATVTNNHLTTSELMKKLNLEQTSAVAKKSPTAARKTTPVIAKTVPKKESEEKASAAARKDTGEKATDKKLLTWPSETTRDDEVAASKKNIFSYLAPGSSRAAKAKKDATDTPKNPGKKVGEKAAGKELLISPSKATGTGGATNISPSKNNALRGKSFREWKAEKKALEKHKRVREEEDEVIDITETSSDDEESEDEEPNEEDKKFIASEESASSDSDDSDDSEDDDNHRELTLEQEISDLSDKKPVTSFAKGSSSSSVTKKKFSTAPAKSTKISEKAKSGKDDEKKKNGRLLAEKSKDDGKPVKRAWDNDAEESDTSISNHGGAATTSKQVRKNFNSKDESDSDGKEISSRVRTTTSSSSSSKRVRATSDSDEEADFSDSRSETRIMIYVTLEKYPLGTVTMFDVIKSSFVKLNNASGQTFEKGAWYAVGTKDQRLTGGRRICQPTDFTISDGKDKWFRNPKSKEKELTNLVLLGEIVGTDDTQSVKTRNGETVLMREYMMRFRTASADLKAVPVTVWGKQAKMSPKVNAFAILLNAKQATFHDVPRFSVGDNGAICFIKATQQMNDLKTFFDSGNDEMRIELPDGVVAWDGREDEKQNEIVENDEDNNE
jgi:hypothetical protein